MYSTSNHSSTDDFLGAAYDHSINKRHQSLAVASNCQRARCTRGIFVPSLLGLRNVPLFRVFMVFVGCYSGSIRGLGVPGSGSVWDSDDCGAPPLAPYPCGSSRFALTLRPQATLQQSWYHFGSILGPCWDHFGVDRPLEETPQTQ